MTLRHMKIFVAVYQNSSITKAAEQLHIVQPSVSLAIKELENYYGICLFDRIGRRIYPTASGTNFYDYAIHIVSLFDEMEQGIRDWDALGSIRVGASITIGNLLLPQIVREFNRLYPDIQVSVTISNAEVIEQNVMDNLVDFGLTEGEASFPQIEQEAVLRDRFCVVAHPSHPLSFHERSVSGRPAPLSPSPPGSRKRKPGHGKRPVPLQKPGALPRLGERKHPGAGPRRDEQSRNFHPALLFCPSGDHTGAFNGDSGKRPGAVPVFFHYLPPQQVPLQIR